MKNIYVCLFLCFLAFKNFTHLKDRETPRDKDMQKGRHREISHHQIHSPNISNRTGWAWAKPGARRSQSESSTCVAGTKLLESAPAAGALTKVSLGFVLAAVPQVVLCPVSSRLTSFQIKKISLQFFTSCTPICTGNNDSAHFSTF